MYKVGGSVVIPSEKVIKIIQENERFDEDVVIYTTDGNAYGIKDCRTVDDEFNKEIEKLLSKWKI